MWIRCTDKKGKRHLFEHCPLCSLIACVIAKKRFGYVPVPISLSDTWHYSAVADSMRGLESKVTDETKDAWKVNTEELSWNLTERLQHFDVLNQMRRCLSCQKQREGWNSEQEMSEQQSIHRLMVRIIDGACQVIKPNVWKQLHASFRNNLLEDCKLHDVFVQGINHSIEKMLYRSTGDAWMPLYGRTSKRLSAPLGSGLWQKVWEKW